MTNTRDRRDRRRTLGRRIAAGRALRDLSQDGLAQLVGLQRPAISLIEAGKRSLPFDELEDIAAALDLPLAWFLADLPTADSARGLSLNEMVAAYLEASPGASPDPAEKIPA